MRRIEVESGSQFGDLTVVDEVPVPSGRRRFQCRCVCGSEVVVRFDHLRSGNTVSCGRCGIEFKGRRLTVREWASLYGIKESTLHARLKVMNLGEALDRGPGECR